MFYPFPASEGEDTRNRPRASSLDWKLLVQIGINSNIMDPFDTRLVISQASQKNTGF
jgi:hypothetical protein